MQVSPLSASPFYTQELLFHSQIIGDRKYTRDAVSPDVCDIVV